MHEKKTPYFNGRYKVKNEDITYCNRLDCDTLDMVGSLIVNKVQFFRCHLDTGIHPSLIYTLVRTVGIGALKADVLYK